MGTSTWDDADGVTRSSHVYFRSLHARLLVIQITCRVTGLYV